MLSRIMKTSVISWLILYTLALPTFAAVTVTYEPVEPKVFTPSTTYSIKYNASSAPELVQIYIVDFDQTSTKKTLVYGTISDTTERTVTWDGKDSNGVTVPNGQYYFKVSSDKTSTAILKE